MASATNRTAASSFYLTPQQKCLRCVTKHECQSSLSAVSDRCLGHELDKMSLKKQVSKAILWLHFCWSPVFLSLWKGPKENSTLSSESAQGWGLAVAISLLPEQHWEGGGGVCMHYCLPFRALGPVSLATAAAAVPAVVHTCKSWFGVSVGVAGA